MEGEGSVPGARSVLCRRGHTRNVMGLERAAWFAAKGLAHEKTMQYMVNLEKKTEAKILHTLDMFLRALGAAESGCRI